MHPRVPPITLFVNRSLNYFLKPSPFISGSSAHTFRPSVSPAYLHPTSNRRGHSMMSQAPPTCQEPKAPSPKPPPTACPPRMDPDLFDQHPVFWFADGDIILQSGRVRFKLHCNVLRAFLPWFKRASHWIDCCDTACSHLQAMEGVFPEPIIQVASVDGVPLLHIDADKTASVPSAAEFALLLDVLHYGV